MTICVTFRMCGDMQHFGLTNVNWIEREGDCAKNVANVIYLLYTMTS